MTDPLYRCPAQFCLMLTLCATVTNDAGAEEEVASLSCTWSHAGRPLNSDDAVATWLKQRLAGVATVDRLGQQRANLSFPQESRSEVLWRLETQGLLQIMRVNDGPRVAGPSDPAPPHETRWLPIAPAIWPRVKAALGERVHLRGGLWCLPVAAQERPLPGSALREASVTDRPHEERLLLRFDPRQVERSSIAPADDLAPAATEMPVLMVIDGVISGFGRFERGKGESLRFDCGGVARQRSIVAFMNAGLAPAGVAFRIDGVPVEY